MQPKNFTTISLPLNSEVAINIGVGVKKVIYVNKIISGILLYVVVIIENI